MTTPIFDTSLLKQEPWRYAFIAEAALPAVMLGIGSVWFAPKNNAAQKVVGRPPGVAFGIIWLFLIIIWTLALILAAMNFQKNVALFGIGIFALCCVIMCFVWLVLYQKMHKNLAFFAILASLAFMFGATLCASTSDSSRSKDAQTLVTVFFGMVGLWLLIASNLSLVELNLQSLKEK